MFSVMAELFTRFGLGLVWGSLGGEEVFVFNRELYHSYNTRIFYTLCGLGSTQGNKNDFGKVK